MYHRVGRYFRQRLFSKQSTTPIQHVKCAFNPRAGPCLARKQADIAAVYFRTGMTHAGDFFFVLLVLPPS